MISSALFSSEVKSGKVTLKDLVAKWMCGLEDFSRNPIL